jgi:hypothetical protein
MPIAVAPSVTQRSYHWTAWKSAVSGKGIANPQYDDDGTFYTIWGYDGPEVHTCVIWKGVVPDSITAFYSQNQNDADRADFETNYKTTYNKSLEPRTTDGALKVDISSVTVTSGTEPPANIVKQAELEIAGRTETDLPLVTYTVPSNKTFRLTTFEASYDAQAPIILRLKKQTGGAGSFVTIAKIALKVQPQDSPNFQRTWPAGLSVGSASDVFKITVEAALIKGSVWAMFAGIEL